MQLLNNQLMKLVLLVVVAAAVLIGLNLNHKKVGRQNALLGSATVVVVGGYLGYMLMEEKSEDLEEENTVPAPVENEVVVNEVVEGFQDNSGSEPESNAGADEASGNAEPDADEEPEPEGVAGNEVSQGSVEQSEEGRNECLSKNNLSAEELLPGSYSSNNWDTPANPGGIDGPNFLNPNTL